MGIEYEPCPHPYGGRAHRGRAMKAYDVVIGDVMVGTIFHVIQSTDRKIGRLRHPGKGRLAWGWRTVGGRCNPPGLYEPTRGAAVEAMTREPISMREAEHTVRRLAQIKRGGETLSPAWARAFSQATALLESAGPRGKEER